MNKILLASLLLFFSSVAYSFTASEILKAIKSDNKQLNTDANLYLSGWLDGWVLAQTRYEMLFNTPKIVCLPKTFFKSMAAPIFEAYAEDHPEKLDLQAGIFLGLAFEEYYLCSPENI